VICSARVFQVMVDPLQKVNVHLTIWTAGRRYWRKLE
jgi:hypothetical protein